MAAFPGIVTRVVDGRVCAYAVSSDGEGVLSPSAVFAPSEGDEVLDHAVTPDLRRLVYTTGDAVVSVVAGAETWRVPFAPGAGHAFHHRPGCVLADGGGDVWLFRPDVMAGRGTADRWLVLDAESGAVRAEAETGTSGHSAVQIAHPSDGGVLLCVGEGQDGAPMLRGTLKDGRLDIAPYPWTDRVLIAVSPDGTRFMTADHSQEDVAFHAHPGGEAVARLTAADFGLDPEKAVVAYAGGFLTADTAAVAFEGEDEAGDDWFAFRLVSLPDASPGPELATGAAFAEDAVFLADGSWLTPDPSGHPFRRRR
ncbi:hypothetical protein GCM10022221_62340 [Actinocorallia aurea]